MKAAGLLLWTAFLSLPLGAQENPAPGALPQEDIAGYVGLTLEAILSRFGTPQGVYPVRGLEEWQDDVVFVYPQGDFYLYRDRVWQVGLKAAKGLALGDSRELVLLVLGEKARDRGNRIDLEMEGYSWPLTLRFQMDEKGRVRGIFLYRPDY